MPDDFMPTMPATLTQPTNTVDSSELIAKCNDARELLLQAGLMLSAWHWRCEKAGYPFREPIGMADLQTRIDAYLFPDDRKQLSGKGQR